MDTTKLAEQIEERYKRYLETTFYFKDPELRKSFHEALAMGHLSKGPYLEATPVFKRGKRAGELFGEILTNPPDEGFLKALLGDRLLYLHQEEAIRKVFSESRNVVVATGTASGKTEAFLYPILLHLYQEFQAGQLEHGARALILYPMNALANDQRERLGEISKRFHDAGSLFKFTFGQYIGETPEDENDSWRHARDHIAHRLPGEIVLRKEMRDNPPHILLTNYSMLEYLLIRPDDSPLFDNGRARWWTFLVLDEAHQYRGSKGIEMGMLLRRLKRRLREGGRTGPFQCIATSATIAGGEHDKPAVAKFASELFGEDFLEEDVILGTTESIPNSGTTNLSLEDYRALQQALHSPSTHNLKEIALRRGLAIPEDLDVTKGVGYILQHDRRSTKLCQLITTEPKHVRELADEVFPDLKESRVRALSELVELLVRTENLSSDTRLLAARYHLFLRSLEGAFVSYFPQKSIFLERCSQVEKGAVFEIALCKECGQHYFVGPKDFKGGKLVEAIRDPNDVNFGATFFRPIENIDEKNEEEEGEDTNNKQVFQLCVQCGEMEKDKPKCGHNNPIQVVREESPKDEDRADQMAKCGACGYNAVGRDPVREVVHGTDGPHAVIATVLYQKLPKNRKKVLAFADGRQEAAFFAWYLENSYKDILNHNLILKTAKALSNHTSEGLSLRELATGLRDVYRENNIFPPAIGDLELRREAWLSLYREFLTDESRFSLEGVGLLRWYIRWPEKFKIPDIFFSPPWSLNERQARDLIFILLDFMRTDRAVELQTAGDVSLTWSDLGIQAYQTKVKIGLPRRTKGVRYWPIKSWDGWDPTKKRRPSGKRPKFLTKLLVRKGLSEEESLDIAVKTLGILWEALRQSGESTLSQHQFLLSVDDARRLNPDWWRAFPISDDDVLYQCDTCARLQAVSVECVCTRHRCPGSVQEIRANKLEANHYRLLYEDTLPGVLRVEEHTAQIDTEKAREFQRAFKAGEIHVLSSSTTFELGVDLGDLDIIFLRNVPPEAFNYAQRVGRAGRRSGFTGFAVTFCRRNPHDLFHYAEPDNRILKGTIRPPVISLRNEKIIIRHIAATALSCFFRVFHERFKQKKDRTSRVDRLFVDMENPTAIEDLQTFLYEHKADIEESLQAIVPPYMAIPVGLGDGTWINKIAGEKSRFLDSEAEISSDYQNALRVKESAKQRDDFKKAQWALGRLKDITEEDILSFLSRKAIIPKYGFPVDVVELDTQRAQTSQESLGVSLQRDLSIAIAEFAPTSKLVADKKEWTSYGLKRVVEKEWERWHYCLKHQKFIKKEKLEQNLSETCCMELKNHKFIIPKFGFLTDLNKPKEPKGRSVRVFTTRPYFIGLTGSCPDEINYGVIKVTKASPGQMVVLCEGRRGRGFYICCQCGAGFRERKSQHETPYGEACSGTLEQVSLGHEFVTDVLRIQFLLDPPTNIDSVQFAYSLAYALVEGSADFLEVPSSDLNTTVAYSGDSALPQIILYDNVPGGAGLVARLEDKEILRACLKSAFNRVNGNCGCGENDSCYGCLRSYRNQFAHHYLKRGVVLYYLETLLVKWKD